MNRRDACRLMLRAAAVIAGTGYVGGVSAADPKLSRTEWLAIKKVISLQLAALRAGQGERAFGFASPGIQAQFADADIFLTMVRAAYAPLLDARYTEFLEGAVIDGPRVGGFFHVRVSPTTLPHDEFAQRVRRMAQEKVVDFVAAVE